MHVLLVQPPIEDFYGTGIRTYPLALLYLAAKIRDICDVSVLDLRTNKTHRIPGGNPFPDLQNYYKEDIYTPLSLFSTYYRFGYVREKIKDTIASYKPDIVGISSLFTTYADEAIEVARICREVDDSIITVAGGTHPTIFPKHILKSPYVDYVIRGEGETPLFELIKSLKTDRTKGIPRIQGVCSKERGRLFLSDIHIESDINLIPDRKYLDPSKYRIGRKNYTFFLTSRGCPFRCAFCGKPPVPYRIRSLSGIEQEISECMDFNIQSIDFEDDMLTLDPAYFTEVLSLFRGKELTLSAMNGIYSETLSTGMLDNMYKAGFRRLNFSLVDINRHVIREEHRFYSTNFLHLIPYLESSPFLVETHFIIGLPDQKPENIIDMLIFLMGKRLLPGPSIFYAAPNTPLFDNFFGNDWERHIKSMRSSFMLPANPLFQRDTTYTLVKLVRFINLVKHLLDQDITLKRLSGLPGQLSGKKELLDKHILTEFITNKRLLCYDLRGGTFFDERQDKSVIDRFFKEAKGAVIKGFKTSNCLVCDV
ncbi:MAG: cobalamin-dependent protein [Deltaproteobacteria bacterium]